MSRHKTPLNPYLPDLGFLTDGEPWSWDDSDAPDDDEIPGIARSLAALLGYAAGLVLLLVVAALVIPIVV